MIKRLAQQLVDYRLLFFVLSLGFIAFAGFGATKLWFESDYEIFFSQEDPQLQAYKEIENAYTKVDNVAFIIGVQSDTPDLFNNKHLQGIRWLTAQGWQLPRSIRVDSISNFQHTVVEGDDLLVSDLVPEDATLDAEGLAKLKSIALSEPALVNAIISKDGRVSSVNVRLEMPEDSREQGVETLKVMTAARALQAEFESMFPELDVHMMGQVVVNHAFNESSERDAGTLVPVMFLVVIVLLAVFIRSFTAVLGTVIIILLSIIATVGVTGWYGYQVNQVNISAPIIILTLAVSDCVHVLMSYFAAMRRGGEKRAAMEEALRINIKPVFLTSLTTAIGFFSLNFSDSPPFRELGNAVGTGVFAAMLWTLCVLPAIMMWLPTRPRKEVSEKGTVFEQFGRWVVKHNTVLFWGLLIGATAIAANAVRNDFNDDTVEYFHESTDIRQAFDFVQENLTGVDTIMYSLPSGEENGIYSPDYLKQVEAFANWYRAQPEVTHVTTFNDVIKRLNQNMNGDQKSFYAIPDDRELAAQYVLLYELSLPLGLDLNDLVTFDKSATRLQVNIANLKAQELIDLSDRADAWLQQNVPDIATKGTSVSILFAHIGQNNIESMMKGSGLALLLIVVTLMVTLRSVKFGLLSLLPNAFPAMIAFGFWGIFVGEVNLAVAVVFSITLGIVVDNTIHFFAKYLHARTENGASPEEAIVYAFRIVGSALTVTAVALGLGFMVLAFSNFGVNSSMGTMTAMTIAIALIFDLLFLPGLLMRFDKGGKTAAAIQ